jgi:rhomboid protease GluP
MRRRHRRYLISPLLSRRPRQALAVPPSEPDPDFAQAPSTPPETPAAFPGNEPPRPEDFLPSPPKPRGPLSRMPDADGTHPALIAFTFFALASLSYWRDGDASPLPVSGVAVFRDHEYWRLFTALFTHSDMGHLLANAPLFLIFGWFLRSFFGRVTFPLAAFCIGVASNLVTVYFYAPATQLVGASGMLYGMAALWLVLYIRFDTDHTVWMRFFRALAFSIAVLFPTTFEPTTSYLAHASGFVIGVVTGLGMSPFLRVRDPRQSQESKASKA